MHSLAKSVGTPLNIHVLIVPFNRLNIQFGAMMGIEKYRYQKFVVLALTWVDFFDFFDIP